MAQEAVGAGHTQFSITVLCRYCAQFQFWAGREEDSNYKYWGLLGCSGSTVSPPRPHPWSEGSGEDACFFFHLFTAPRLHFNYVSSPALLPHLSRV